MQPASESKEKNDHTTKEYEYGTAIASQLRTNTNMALGDLLTTIEAATPEGHQLKALKKLVKERMWILADSNQHAVYRTLNVE
jgi:deoxyxylulose-5-phosphate synthase